ncbi:hypothetical protein [Paenibacillus sp. P13VS]|uniref:hypothetical protein n=1 Tax=Paenibacillus sp. P13VS TaxID=2697367 RepID=UPI00187B3D85|nr:hypothetical protein [Paenibacillus sp. P13VS]MBE7680780.1 hypothetical protein [Paenibacillus sp. P13VS]
MSNKKDENNEEMIVPEHHSAVRHILNEANGKPNDMFVESFLQAKNTNGTYVIMEGDWGGQVYLSCPMDIVKCNEDTLKNLLIDLDTIAWDCNEGEGKGLYYEVRQPEEGICGGMGGGEITEKLWIHEEFSDLNLYEEIEIVLSGAKEKLKE